MNNSVKMGVLILAGLLLGISPVWADAAPNRDTAVIQPFSQPNPYSAGSANSPDLLGVVFQGESSAEVQYRIPRPHAPLFDTPDYSDTRADRHDSSINPAYTSHYAGRTIELSQAADELLFPFHFFF